MTSAPTPWTQAIHLIISVLNRPESDDRQDNPRDTDDREAGRHHRGYCHAGQRLMENKYFSI